MCSLLLHACSTGPTEPEVTINDFLADVDVYLSSVSNGEAFASAAMSAPSGPFGMVEPSVPLPSPGQVQAIAPGTASVVTWPVHTYVDIQITCRNEESICIRYPYLTEELWPHWNVGPEGSGTIGLAWVIYRVHGRWVAEGVDWLRSPERRNDAALPMDHFTQGRPRGNDPVGIFLAGPSRYSPDIPAYRYRSATKWWRWSDLAPIETEVDIPEDEPEIPEEPEEILEEAWITVTGFSTEGASIGRQTFEADVPVELLGLNGARQFAVNYQVPFGSYDYVEVTLDASRSRVVVSGVDKPLTVPDTVRVDGPFDFTANATSVILTFDADASIVEDGNGNWSLVPKLEFRVESQ